MTTVWDSQPANFKGVGKEYFHQNVSCKIHKQLTLRAILVYLKDYEQHKLQQLWPIMNDKETVHFSSVIQETAYAWNI